MNDISTWQGAIFSSWTEVWSAFLGVLPKVLGAIVIFAVGLILAYWVKKLVMELLKLVKLEKLTRSAGIDRYLSKAEIKMDFSELLGTVVEWIVVLVFFLAVVDVLGLSVVSQVVLGVLGFIPNLLAAILIFAAGYVVGGLVDGVVRGALTSIDHEVAKPLGKISRMVIILIAFFAAIDQLRIANALVATFFQGLTYTVVLVVGLSVGLGAKDLVSKVLNDWYDRIHK